MAGFENDVVYSKNADFTTLDNQSPSESNGLATNGQFWIGTTAVNAGGTHVNVGTITSPLGTLAIGYSSPNITLDLAGGSVGIDSITVDSNNAPGTNPVLPTAGGNINIQGIGETTSVSNAVNSFGIYEPRTAKFIVDPTQYYGTHQTIAAAITAASSGQTIFIRPGTYTENLTLKAGVNLTAFECDALTPNVTIVGNATATFAGTATLSGIRLQTTSAALLTVSGSEITIVNLIDCFLNCTNNTGITLSSSSASSKILLKGYRGDLGTTGIGLFAHSGAGSLTMRYCTFTNTGGSTTDSTCSAGTLDAIYCVFNGGITTSGTASFNSEHNIFSPAGAGLNDTALTAGGSGGHTSSHDLFSSGTASAISVGAGCNLVCNLATVSSSNTISVTGAGTFSYSGISFSNTSSVMNTTTQTANYTNLGKWKASGQPAFSAYQAATVTNVTGAGTTYQLGTTALTEVFDQDGNFNTNGTFTAPVTGKYQLNGMAMITGCTVATGLVLQIITERTQA